MNTKDPVTSLLQAGKRVVIRRIFDARCELVWNAWTSPELIAKWFSASAAIKMNVLELDVRTGGRFRFVFSNPDGSVLPGEYTGTYTLVDPPGRLSFNVIDYSQTRNPAGITAQFEVELAGVGQQTQLTLTATLPDESYLKRTTVDWNACFDNLAVTLSKVE